MDSVLSTKNRTAKRKDHKENQVAIQVNKARYIDGYKVELEFNDKTLKTIDFEDFLIKHPHPAHNKYKDINLFKQFKIESGNIVWGENWDLIFPLIQLYKGRIKV